MNTSSRKMRLFIFLFVALLECVNDVRTVRAKENDGDPSKQSNTSDLPEVFRLPLPNNESLRDRLFKGTINSLNGIVAKHPDDLELTLNCERAKQLAVHAYDVPNADPVMLDAWLVPAAGRRPMLMYDAFNPRRETNLLLLVGKKPDGGLVRLYYHFDMQYKDDVFVAMRGKSVQQVTIDEVRKLGRTVQSPSGEEVHFDVGFGPIPIPNFWPMVAAVGDRSGRTSNFVIVHEIATGSSTHSAPNKDDASTDNRN